MKALATTFVLSLLLFASPVMAGVGHDHGHSHAQTSVDQKVAEENADAVIASFVEKGKIDKSWASIKVSSAEKKEFNERTEWVLIYINEEITDADKQKLYVFLTEAGEYIAINYTGN
ncbi:MAG: DUF6488 family protein [Xanthomonadales bacterium]|nr:DUF6488 family protein [Xanthomonadales bacterium]